MLPDNPSPKKQGMTSQLPSTPQKTKPILKSSSIEEFVQWCEVARDEDWSACLPGMRSEEVYPDEHLEKIPNNELRRALGLGLGSIHRFRAAVSEFWKLEVERHHSSPADPNPQPQHPMASTSLVGQKRKTPEDDWVLVPYKRKYKDGEKRMAFRHYKDGRSPTYDDGTPVFNPDGDGDEWWGKYVEEQVKLHYEENVEDFVMVGEGGYWMHIPPTGGGFFNPITDNASLYTVFNAL
jgi:hypothetical protein